MVRSVLQANLFPRPHGLISFKGAPMKTFSIKDAVKNIRKQNNFVYDIRIRDAVSRVFELLEESLDDTSWTFYADDGDGYCQTIYSRIRNKQGEAALENLDIRLYKDRIQLNASLCTELANIFTSVSANALKEFIIGRTKHYDFPIDLKLFIAESLIYNFKYTPSNIY